MNCGSPGTSITDCWAFGRSQRSISCSDSRATSNAALDGDDHLIFRRSDDTLWFDSNGSNAGGTKVMIADRTGASAATVNTTATGNADTDWTNKQEGKDHFATTPEYSPTYAAITARSYFPGSVNVAMMDGSVRTIENNINLGVWRAISTRNGKEKLPNSFGQ